MSEYAEKAREGMKAKMKRMFADPGTPTDASGYKPPGPELGMVQTGERPVTRPRFRSGGSVSGAKTAMRADRKPRASGGMTSNEYLNRDVREANKSREGTKHDGGFKRGGRIAHDGRARAHKFMGGPMMGNASPYVSSMGGTGGQAIQPGQAQPAKTMARGGYKSGGKVHKDEAQDRKLIHEMGCKCAKCHGGSVKKATGGGLAAGNVVSSNMGGAAKTAGGRLARKAGGAAKKGGMNVNIIIAPPKSAGPMMPPGAPMGGPPRGIPAPPPAAMGPPAGMPPPGVGAPPPMGAPPPAMRKFGGRAYGKKGYPIKDGAGGGLGRLEKAGLA